MSLPHEVHADDSSSFSSAFNEEKDFAGEGVDNGFVPIIPTSTRPGPSDIDGADLLNLPSRTLSNNARLDEYTQETVDGQIPKRVLSNKSGRIEDYDLVTWKIDDPENPKNWSKAYKWWCTMCVAATCFAVAFNSAVITADIEGVAQEFGCSEEVALLSVTLFVYVCTRSI